MVAALGGEGKGPPGARGAPSARKPLPCSADLETADTSGMGTTATSRIDIFSPSFCLAMLGLGLLAIATVEATRFDGTSSPHAVSERVELAPSAPALGTLVPAGALDALLQDAVGAGPGAPRPAPRAGGGLVGIAAAPMPNGLALFRLYANGAVEAMITTEENRWGPWVPVAPGRSTDMRRPPAESGSDNPDTESNP
jgi:hypothetical protein